MLNAGIDFDVIWCSLYYAATGIGTKSQLENKNNATVAFTSLYSLKVFNSIAYVLIDLQ